jgi:WhiB family redox-sensing transcriptional regulator
MTPLPSLPAPVSSNWDWQLDAACRDTNNDVFFHPPGERKRHRQQRISAAKQVCAACPVITQCREHALAAVEPYGIWGGLSEDERADLLGLRDLKYPARLITRIGTGSPIDGCCCPIQRMSQAAAVGGPLPESLRRSDPHVSHLDRDRPGCSS